MKKIFLLVICLMVSVVCTSCKNEKSDFVEENNKSKLTELRELNGEKTEGVYKYFFNTEYEWKFVDGKTGSLGNVKFKYGIFYGQDCIGLELDTEEEARKVAEYYNGISHSFCYKGKFAFPARLSSFVFFYNEDEIQGNREEGYWIEENGEKTLLIVGQNHPVVNGVITIDGYERISYLALAGTFKNNFKKLIIGDSVKVLYYGAITGKMFDEIVFSKNLKEIHGGITSENNTTFKTIIPITVEFVGKYSFAGGNIYCEQQSKPKNWDSEFCIKKAKVYWAGEWEYDENGEPRPIKDAN